MRIIALGLGGGGSRIVDRLYAADRHSSKISCVQALAVDVDEDCLKNLGTLPNSCKLFFPPMDPNLGENNRDVPVASVEIGDIVAKVQTFESGENDAIFLCLGLGGTLSDAAARVIAELRTTTTEPIFGLVTLPCLAEGERRSAKAADDLDILGPLLDGMILFDNETWYKKTAELKRKILNREKGFIERLGLGKQEPELSPEMLTYRLLNDSIVRRISLILRAGEFRADGGIDLAETVLDSGEVLNTMTGMGFITIGYAVDHVQQNPLGFLSLHREKSIFDEESKKNASRIVDLAKQAIYHEVSTPCDMTSAHKALILVAGPTHELSMKGFMTVRKWIDRSIAGLETRSGDYPVVNTKNIAIIIMLSGLENIPRVSELREIREHFRNPLLRERAHSNQYDQVEEMSFESTVRISDEKIILPPKTEKTKEFSQKALRKPEVPPPSENEVRAPAIAKTPVHYEPKTPPSKHAIPDNEGYPNHAPDSVIMNTGQKAHSSRESDPHPPLPAQRVSYQEQQEEKPALPPVRSNPVTSQKPAHESPKTGAVGTARVSPNTHPDTAVKPPQRETPQQRIERELAHQRILVTPTKIIRSRQEPAAPGPKHPGSPRQNPSTIPSKVDLPDAQHQEPKKTVIIARRKTPVPSTSPPSVSPPIPKQEKYVPDEFFEPEISVTDQNMAGAKSQEPQAILKEPEFQVKDQIFEGKAIQRGFVPPPPRDSALLKANLHLGRKTHAVPPQTRTDQESHEEDSNVADSGKKERKSKSKDDISWI